MKKKLRLLLAVLLSTISIVSYSETIPVLYTFPKVDGIYYISDASGNEKYVIEYDEDAIPNFDGHLVIPTTVRIDDRDYPVTGIMTIVSTVPLNANRKIPLKSITIPESIKTISSSVFHKNFPIDTVYWDAPNCTDGNFNNGIKYIEIGPHVTTLPENFLWCESLEELKLGENVETLESYSISYTQITTLEIPASVKNIDKTAFASNKKLKKLIWNVIDGNAYNWQGPYGGYDQDIEEIVFGDAVVVVPEYFCEGMTSLKKVSLGKNVTTIGTSAFRYCHNLEGIEFPENVDSIGYLAFDECEKITTIELPAKLTRLSYKVFSNTSIESIVIHDNIEIIEHGALGSDKLTTLYIGKNVKKIESSFPSSLKKLTWNVINSDCTKFSDSHPNWSALEELIIGDDVTTIPAYFCRSEDNLKSVTLGKNVTTIGTEAFAYCTNLPTIEFPENVDSIGSRAFYDCQNLSSLELPAKLTKLYQGVFQGTGITSLVIHDNITDVAYGFGGDKLTSVYIGKNVKNLELREFSNVKHLTWNVANSDNIFFYLSNNWGGKLEEVVIGDNVTHIPNYFCAGENNLKSVSIGKNVKSIGYEAFFNCNYLISVTIPNTVESIGENAFYEVGNITYSGSATGSPWGARYVNGYVDGYLVYSDDTQSHLILCSKAAEGAINLPDNVTNIDEEAFYECSGLTEITLGNSLKSIEEKTFYKCTGLTSVTMPNTVASIGEQAFSGCTNLQSVTIPNSLTTIGEWAFSGCENLTEITLPESLTNISQYAFCDCSGLILVTIPKSVTSIGYSAFSGCSSLTTVTIGSSVTSIGLQAFGWCNSLSEVYNYAVIPQEITDVFRSVSLANCTLYVREQSVDFYKNATVWSGFSKILPINRTTPKEAITVRLDPQSCTNWSTVRLHYWGFYIGDGISTDWPGIVINQDADGWYSYTFDDSIEIVNILWTDDGTNQTIDIRNVEESTCYSLNSNSGKEISVTIVDCPSDSDPTPLDDLYIGSKNATKLLSDGQIFIIRGEKTYTLTGQEVR